MTTQVGERRLRVNWHYSPDKKKTTCFILNEEGEQMASVTICRFHKDNFEYEKARKVSLKRVLETSDLNRTARTAIWAAYFARKKK